VGSAIFVLYERPILKHKWLLLLSQFLRQKKGELIHLSRYEKLICRHILLFRLLVVRDVLRPLKGTENVTLNQPYLGMLKDPSFNRWISSASLDNI
jgi:hypothetical protein